MHPTRIFKTPSELSKAWRAYQKEIESKSNEWQRVKYVGRHGNRKADPQKIPYTMVGFQRFCRENYGYVHNYFDNPNGLYDEFKDVCQAIKEAIRENQIIGGMLGFYEPNITQHLNGLSSKKRIEIREEESVIPMFKKN